MFLSGIADEASPQLERQLAAHKELGWNHIEIRNIEGTNLTDLSDTDFDRVVDQLTAAEMKVSCFAAQIANWSRPISSDIEVDIAELNRAIPRMHRLGTPFIRCMSYPNADPAWDEKDWRAESIKRMKVLAQIAADGGVTLVHENCSGWGGQGAPQTVDLLKEVNSEALKLVFDTGNPIEYNQDAWDYYDAVRDDVVYVHIKDYADGDDGKPQAVYAGEGKGYVRKILGDLFAGGYDGGISIEPHITSVIHLAQEASDPELAYKTYVEYGRRLEKLIAEIR